VHSASFITNLAIFASLKDFPFLLSLHSTPAQLPSDTVHTVLYLMVALTFLLAESAKCGALCKLLAFLPTWNRKMVSLTTKNLPKIFFRRISVPKQVNKLSLAK
jgi:hypothetical protein